MYNNDMPSHEELPSSGKLIRSTVIAAVVAAVLLVTVVMPAEYALDPTGAGRLLGLTEMGEIKAQLDEEEAADLARQAQPAQSAAVASAAETTELASEPAAEEAWKDEIRVVLAPGEGTEYKLTMDSGAVARYSWMTEGGPLNYDKHGDAGEQFTSYKKGRGVASDAGELQAAFTGSHGWFFRNRNDSEVTLVLRTSGDYGELKKAM